MFGFNKKMVFTAMMFFIRNALKYVSMNNQECKVRSAIINIISNEPLFYPNSILVNKCSSSCSNINNPYAKLYVPDVIKDTNIYLMSKLTKQDMYLGMRLVHVNVD